MKAQRWTSRQKRTRARRARHALVHLRAVARRSGRVVRIALSSVQATEL